MAVEIHAGARPAGNWRSFGAFSAFLVALFTEMYGFPPTIYPNVDFFSLEAGHQLEVLFGWKPNPHWGPFHVASNIFIFGGFWLLSSAWNVLYRGAQREHRLATCGVYARVRHRQ